MDVGIRKMKKSIISFILIICLVLSLSSCRKDERLLNRTYGENSTTPISLSERQTIIASPSIKLIYVYDSKCETCQKILSEMNELSLDESLKIYAFDLDNTGLDVTSPSLEIYDGNNLVKRITKTSDLSRKERILSDIRKYVSITSLREVISLDELNTLMNSSKALVLYQISGCTDCIQMDERFLNDYVKKDEGDGTPIYLVNLSTFPYNERYSYQEFKDYVGLSNKNNNLGYGKGFVPSFVLYELGKIEGEAVFYNDQINFDSGKERYTILDSYYDDSPYINSNFYSMEEYYRKTSKFYEKKVLALLKIVDE